MRASHGHYLVPLPRRAVGCVLEIQTGAMGLAIRDDLDTRRHFYLVTFLALFNYLTPSGRVTVTGRVVEVTPNVTGQIVAIPVKPNVPVKANDVLFQIDPAKLALDSLRA
jgi:multidrug resistance efflux pump